MNKSDVPVAGRKGAGSILAVLLVLITVNSCAVRQTGLSAEDYARFNELYDECYRRYPDVLWITVTEFMAREDYGEWVIVDARSEEERNVSVIPGAVSHEEYEYGKTGYHGRNVLVYCTSGCRSGEYARKIMGQGIKVYDLLGGVLAWAADGREFVAPSGEPTKRVHVFGTRWNVLPQGYQAVW